MDNTLKEILRAINSRFPKGRHCSRINLMIEGDIVFNFNEVLNHLIEIKEFGGSDKYYININDKIDALFYITQLKEYLDQISSE